MPSRPSPLARSVPLWSLALAGAAAVLSGVAGLGAGVVIGRATAGRTVGVAHAGKHPLAAPVDRKAVEGALLGASPDDVRAYLGAPKQVLMMRPHPGEALDEVQWVYDLPDPEPGRSKTIAVGFYKGRVSGVLW